MDELKPLPKPVSAAPPRRERPVQNRPAPAQPPVNPDDFEVPDRQRQPRPPEPPTFGEALVIFAKRLRKKATKSAATRRTTPSPNRRIPASQTNPHSNESRRIAAARKKQRKLVTRLAGLSAALIFIIATAVFLVIWLTGKNAYEVTLGGERIGYIALSEDIDAARLQSQFVNRLSESINAKVQVDQTVALKEVNTSRSNIIAYEEMVDLLSRSKKLTYKISAVALIVEGQEIAILKSETEVNAVRAQLEAPYRTENTVDADFLESWVEETRLVDESQLGTVEDALLQLDKKERVMEDYIVKSGDTLDKIALANNTTAAKLCEDTPGLTLTSVLQIGQIIKLETTRPYLSVRTVDEFKRTEEIPMEIQTTENHSQPKTYNREIQEGRAGVMEITIRSTRVNGRLERPEEPINSEITEPMVPRQIEVGTQVSNPR
jgi:LysM repeat protein